MTTSTKELIAELMQCHNGHTDEGESTFSEAAQRLRELDKPDCVWKSIYEDGEQYYESPCNIYAAHSVLPRYCHYCGGSVRRVHDR